MRCKLKKKDLLTKPTNCQKIDANLQNALRITFYEIRLATKQPNRRISYAHHWVLFTYNVAISGRRRRSSGAKRNDAWLPCYNLQKHKQPKQRTNLANYFLNCDLRVCDGRKKTKTWINHEFTTSQHSTQEAKLSNKLKPTKCDHFYKARCKPERKNCLQSPLTARKLIQTFKTDYE